MRDVVIGECIRYVVLDCCDCVVLYAYSALRSGCPLLDFVIVFSDNGISVWV